MRGLYNEHGKPLPLRSQEECVRLWLDNISAFLAGGSFHLVWLDITSSRGAAPAPIKEADQ